MKIKRILLPVICVIFILLPFFTVGYTAFSKIPAKYDETFLGEFCEKHERLATVEGKKLVLVGGSNLAFGIDSELLEEYTGMPVVNYGLYADLGTKVMLDMSEKHLEEGDVVVICPELNSQTYSLYYNADAVLQSYDSDPSMLADAKLSNTGKLLGGLPNFANAKYEYHENDTKPIPREGDIYSKSSFDEYGDIYVERDFNRMYSYYDKDMMIEFSADIIGDGFIDYLNDYARKAEKKGANVYFSFPPMNSKAVTGVSADKEAFYRYLGENLEFPIISDIDDYILHYEYFYDTNFHLNDRGALLRTALLADDILRELGITEYRETVKYSYIERPDNYFGEAEEDSNTEYFVFEKSGDTYSVTGVSEKGKNETTLTIPAFYEGLAVTELASDALSECDKLETFVIPENAKIETVGERAFADCEKLVRIEVYMQPSDLTVNAKIFDGMKSTCFVYVPTENYGVFAGDYFWGGMMKYVKPIEE